MSRRALPSKVPHGSAAGTRELALSAARRLIQTRSFLGFSFQDLADAVGVRKPSLYHHFPSKESLGLEVLSAARDSFRSWTQSVAARSPKERLEAYFQMYRNDIRAGERMCPGGSFVASWDCVDEELRRGVREIRSEQILWLTGLLGSLLPADPGASALASYIYASCQGALTTARMTGRVADFDEVMSLAKRTLFS